MAKSMKNAAELFAENTAENVEITAENVELTDVDETPVNEELVDEVVTTDEQGNKVSEEAVEEIVNEIIDADIIINGDIVSEADEVKNNVFPTRGFKNLKDAKEWTKSPSFTNLGKADQKEFLDWLNDIK